jgi:EmrB/QacA subfamily drug resistance transporter
MATLSGSAGWAPQMGVEKERAHQTSTLTITCLGLFVVLLDSTIVSNALPPIQAAMNASLSGLAWVVDSYILPFAVLLLLAGSLCDRFGRKRMFCGGLAAFSGGALVCGLAPGLAWLNTGQAICGAAGAAIATGGMSLLVTAFPDPKQRTRAVGAYAALGGVALSAGPLLGGVLVDTLGWRWIFYANLPVTTLALLAAAALLRESRNPQAQGLDLPGQLAAVGGLTLLTYALIEANDKHWGSPLIIGCLLGAGVLLAAFVVVQARSAAPTIPLGLFRQPAFSMANLATAVVGFALIGATFFFAQYFQTVLGYTAFRSGQAGLPATIGMAVTAPLAARMAARWGFRVPVVVGGVLGGTGLVSLAWLTPDLPYGNLWWRLALFGVGCGLMVAPLAAVVITTVPARRAGLASAVNNTSRQVGSVFGVAVLGTLVQQGFAAHIGSRLAALRLPPAVTAALAQQLAHRSSAPPPSSAPPAVVAAVRAAAGAAFTDALHLAFVVAGLALLVLVLPCWFALRSARPADLATPRRTPAAPATRVPAEPAAPPAISRAGHPAADPGHIHADTEPDVGARQQPRAGSQRTRGAA